LGLHQVGGLGAAAGQRIVAARAARPFSDVADLSARAGLQRKDLDALVAANALARLSGHRRQAAWACAAAPLQGDLLSGIPLREERPALAAPSEAEEMAADYASMALTLGRHPVALLRAHLDRHRYQSAAALRALPDRQLVRCAGLVT